MVYLDNAATTAPSALCAQTVNEVLTDCFANPSSLYPAGLKSAKRLTAARSAIAAALGIKLSVSVPEIIFTASGSESNNIAILGSARARSAWGSNIVLCGYEHPSAYNTCMALKNEGFEIRVINPSAEGEISLPDIVNSVDKNTALVCAMHVNNETGAIINVCALADMVKEKNGRTAVHIDGVQAFCKQEINLEKTKIDTYAISGHKLHAPKGIGALYIRKGFNISCVLHGGGQERALRPGTENIAFAAAFAVCAEHELINRKASQAHIDTLNNALWQGLWKIEGIVRNCPENCYKGIANFSVNGVKSQPLLNALAQRGICVSSGSACSRGAQSHTLFAMGLSAKRIDTAIRVSFCAENTIDDVNELLNALAEIKKTIAKIN